MDETAESETPQEQPDNAGVAFQPPILILVCLLIGFGLRELLQLEFMPTGTPRIAGPTVVGLALSFFAWAVYTMQTKGGSVPTGTPTPAIVRKGPYRFTRNPIYLAMVTLLIGTGLWSNSAWFLTLAVIAAVALNQGVIIREEAYLTRKFGDEYLAYKQSVRRWI